MFNIDNMSQTPVYEQLVDEAERYVLMDIMKSGDSMPSVRSLSMELSINPNTIQKAYSELTSRGVLFSVPGKGCFVSEDAKELIGKQKRRHMENLRKLTSELKLAGVTESEITNAVHEIFINEGEKI